MAVDIEDDAGEIEPGDGLDIETYLDELDALVVDFIEDVVAGQYE